MAEKRSKNVNKRRAQQKQAAKQKKEQLIFAIGAVAIAVLAFIVFTGSGSSSNANGSALEVNTQTGKQMFDDGAFMLDVRTPEEWEMYHVDGATLIELDELQSRIDEVPRDRQIVVICNSGNRSKVGRDILLDAGFENVVSIAGGIKAWMSAGYDVVRGN